MSRASVVVEIIAAMGFQYGVSKLLAAGADYAEHGEQRELGTYPRVPSQRQKLKRTFT